MFHHRHVHLGYATSLIVLFAVNCWRWVATTKITDIEATDATGPQLTCQGIGRLIFGLALPREWLWHLRRLICNLLQLVQEMRRRLLWLFRGWPAEEFCHFVVDH